MGSMSLAEMIADFILSAEDEELARARAVLVKDAADVALERKASMGWQPISTADRKAKAVLCDHQDWHLPMWCWWGENVRGHAEGRWYQVGELEWLEPQPEVWLPLPPRLKSDAR